MASIMENFSNSEIDITTLPKFEEVEFRPVSPQLLKKELLGLGIFFAVVLVVLAVIIYFGINSYYLYAGLVLFPLYFGFNIWNIFKIQKEYGYALRERDILFKRGYLVNRKTVVPLNRIQHATVSRGVFDKLFGISTLNVFTAGGSGSDIRIPGLLPDTAFQLKEKLSQKISEDEE